MRTSPLVVLVMLVGCGEQQTQQQGDNGWVAASPALQAHGVYSLSTSGETNARVVQLRGAAQESIGSFTVTEGPATHSATLVFGNDTWSQSFSMGEQASMVISLKGTQAPFTFNGGAWVGDAAGQSLMARSQPFIDLAALVGSEMHLTISTPATATEAAPAGVAPGNQPSPASPAASTLTCTTIVVTATGSAFFFEPASKACERAQALINVQCHAATTSLATPQGLDCCNTPEPTCFNAFNAGLFTFASTYGYLNQFSQ